MSTAKHKAAGFRPEIEGLRAVAALLVAIYHIWLGRVSGGVDVFFVITSFFITGGLIRQIETAGRIDLARFWARLIKRLIPAAFLVLCAVIAASILFLPKSRWSATLHEVGAAAVYLENWLLMRESVDYLAQHSAASPVQHFWALSIQGQFYVVCPLVLMCAAFWARRLKLTFRQVALGVIGAIGVASFCISIYLTAKNQPLAYFHPLARAWEFCIGAALVMLLPQVRLPSVAKVACGWFGLAALLSCGLLLHVSQVFPGYAALWPTGAAVLIIVSGGSGSRFGADRLLASRPLVSLGAISYGIYLWHFPILVFCRAYAAPQPLNSVEGVGILLAAVVLAAITHKLVEEPVQRSEIGTRRPQQVFAFALACLVPVAVGLTSWKVYFERIKAHEILHLPDGDHAHPGALAVEPVQSYRIAATAAIFPGPLSVSEDRDILPDERCQYLSEAMKPVCTLGNDDARVTIAVVGGSHSSQWLPALDTIGARLGWRIVSYTRSNCPFYVGDSVGEKKTPGCHEWNQQVFEALLRLRPTAVFTTATRHIDEGEIVPPGYVRQWQRLAAAAIPVIAIRDNPDFDFDVSACVELHGMDSPHCAIPRAELLAKDNPVLHTAQVPSNVRFIDLTNYFCDLTTCYPVIGNVLIYRHENHITATYVRSLTGILEQQMQRFMTPLAVPVGGQSESDQQRHSST